MNICFPKVKANKNLRIPALIAALAFTWPAAAQTFVSTTDYPAGPGPNNVATADINGDNMLDLICASKDTNTLTVLTNNGAGSFTQNAVYQLGNTAFVVAADLRNSGHPDLIAAIFSSNTVVVLTNNGSGTFGSNATYVVGNGPFNAVSTDVNGDHQPDLITANDGLNFIGGNTVTVLTNNGSGILVSNATYTVGKLPSVTAADLRGSGRPDLITANYDDDSITVLTNDGSGGFAFNATYNLPANSFPINVVAADVNGDDKPDLISANSAANTLTVLTNNGNGTFTFSATLTVQASPYVTAADVNGDGQTDLVTANFDDDSLSVLTNNGSGILSSNATYTLASNSRPIYLVAADLNNDGRTELISVNYGNDSLTVRMEVPMLAIKLANQLATLSWPLYWGGYELQQTTNLSSSFWNDVNNPSGTNVLNLPVTPGNNFYRLRHP